MSIGSNLRIVVLVSFIFLLVVSVEKKAYPEEAGAQALFEKRCSKCHSIDKTNRTGSADYWKSTVQKMKKKFFSGISEEDAAVITEYLIKTKGLPESDRSGATEETNDK